MYVTHQLVNKDTIESRLYQEVIVGRASGKNTLVVAPTALGKTVIAVLLAAHRLEKFPDSRILMVSTTRPLVNQHARSFRQFLKLDEKSINVLTGHTPPAERVAAWKSSKIVCATPQVVKNDLAAEKYSLDDVSLAVFDEAHRATGEYPYAFIAGRYVETSKNPLILGLTASPGGDKEKIDEVCANLFITNVEIRTESDPDVRPYIKGIDVEWHRVRLPEEFLGIRKELGEVMNEKIRALKNMGFVKAHGLSISKKELLELRENLQEELKENRAPEAFVAISNVAACINVSHALELLETQGLVTLSKYFERMRDGRSKAVVNLMKNSKFMRAVRMTENLSSKVHHPKLDALLKIVGREAGKRIIVFTQYRDTAQKIVECLEGVKGATPVKFVGQASKDEDRGLSQKQQLEILEKFRGGEHNVLVATSVAEEGLDIPKVDLVIFYEPIPSEIRSIQRRGRTGRSSVGKVIVLMTENSMDEGFYWSSFHKERRMRGTLAGFKQEIRVPKVGQRKIGDFF